MNINENLKEIVKISFLIIKNIFNNFCLFNNLRYFFKYLFIYYKFELYMQQLLYNIKGNFY